MPIGKKLAVVLSVVVAGVSVALFFRKDASPFKLWFGGSDDPFDQQVERRASGQSDWLREDALFEEGRVERVPTAATAAILQPGRAAADGQPAFQKNLNPVGALLPPIEGALGDVDELDDEELAADGSAFAVVGQSLRHTVVDGDTLSLLASRYLGSADASLEIYNFNRDVLNNPELLPIGAVIRIPPRRRRPAAEDRLLKLVPVPDRGDQASR